MFFSVLNLTKGLLLFLFSSSIRNPPAEEHLSTLWWENHYWEWNISVCIMGVAVIMVEDVWWRSTAWRAKCPLCACFVLVLFVYNQHHAGIHNAWHCGDWTLFLLGSFILVTLNLFSLLMRADSGSVRRKMGSFGGRGSYKNRKRKKNWFIETFHQTQTQKKHRDIESFNEVGLVIMTALISLGSEPMVYVLSRSIGATSPLCRTHKHNVDGSKHKFPQSLRTDTASCFKPTLHNKQIHKEKACVQTRWSTHKYLPTSKMTVFLFCCTHIL